MTAFIIFHSTVNDPENFATYAKSVPATLKPFGGTVLARGKAEKIFSGDHGHASVGILSFPSLEEAHDWYESDAYQSLISVRDSTAAMTVISYSEPTS